MEILVIGGGVIGVCSAYSLLKEGRSVTIIEQGEIGSGCSYGNAGLVVPGHAAPLARPGIIGQGLRWMLSDQSPFFVKPRLDLVFIAWLWAFWRASSDEQARQSARILNLLVDASRRQTSLIIEAERLECDFLETGMMQVFRTEKGLRDTVEEEQHYKAVGFEPQLLNGQQARALEPTIRNDIAGALLHPRDASFNPNAFVSGLSDACAVMGGDIRPHCKVLDFELSGGRVHRVITSGGDYTPDLVILAAGSWTPHLGRKLALKIPIQPAKGYSLTFQAPKAGPAMPLLLGEDWVAVTPMGEEMRLAGTLELAGDDLSINPKRVQAVAAAPSRYLNIHGEMNLIETWSGARPTTPDGLPIIGSTPGVVNLIIAAGHGMLGMTLGPVTGMLVADLVCERQSAIDINPLSLGRFN